MLRDLDGVIELDVQAVEHGDEWRIADLTRPTTAPCGSPVEARSIASATVPWSCVIGNGVRLPALAQRAERISPVRRGAQDTPESLNTRRRLLVDGAALHYRRPSTAEPAFVFPVAELAFVKRPVGKCGKPGRLTLPIEIDPGLRQVVKITA